MINIEDIIPYLKSGWVVMTKDGMWIWCKSEPTISKTHPDCWNCNGITCELDAFNIAPADDWTKSLICVKGKDNER